MKLMKVLLPFLVFIITLPLVSQDYHTIYEIQGQSSSSPYNGQVVKTRGIVTGVFANGFFIEEKPGGPWRGIYVYTGSAPTIERKDSVEVTGEITEYFNTTEFTNNPSVTVLSSNRELPAVIDTITGELDQEKYEGVYAVVHNVAVTDTSDFGQYDEWFVNDGSGNLMIDYTMLIDKQGDYQYRPVEGDTIPEIRGIMHYSFYNYKLIPRDDKDILLMPVQTDVILSPVRTFAGTGDDMELFLSIPDTAGFTLSDIHIRPDLSFGLQTDNISLRGEGTAGATIEITDSLITITSLEVNDSISVSFGIQTIPENTGIYNFKVEVSFDGNTYYDIKPIPSIEVITPPDKIYRISTIQGKGYQSPFTDSGWVWIRGSVTTPNFSDDGYTGYIQDSTAGINLFSYDNLNLKYGYEYLLRGEIEEYNGLTEFKPDMNNITLLSMRNNPVDIDTLPVSVGLSERFEGHLVSIQDAIVIEEPGSPAGGGSNASIRNGQIALNMRILTTSGIIDSLNLEENSRWNITGVVGQYDTDEPYTSGYQLIPRFISDLEYVSFEGDTSDFKVSIEPNPFAPDMGDVTRITISSPLNYAVSAWIYDVEGRKVRHLIVNHPGPVEEFWMGRDGAGRRVTIGTYILHVEAKSPLGHISSITQPIVVATELGGS